MLENTAAFSSFSTDDIAGTRAFYADRLKVPVTEDQGMLHLELSGAGKILIYPKPDHQPATFTVLNFQVTDIQKAVAGLKQAGIVFESYPYLHTDENNIMRSEEMRVAQAWFKDPGGNILSVIQTW
ncbi:VOC family protein [Taibaiella koreensis]|uniref:VOC family protein n=1 Tax=Taibaiella koreensis TaxID=1268548 RepID=UPI000E59F8CC|nr:VOC family protein [Taibaiella koreensis]